MISYDQFWVGITSLTRISYSCSHQYPHLPESRQQSLQRQSSLTRVTSVKSANAQWVSDWVTPITSWASCYATNLAQLKLIWVAMVGACLCLVREWVELGVKFAASNLSSFWASIGKDWQGQLLALSHPDLWWALTNTAEVKMPASLQGKEWKQDLMSQNTWLLCLPLPMNVVVEGNWTRESLVRGDRPCT